MARVWVLPLLLGFVLPCAAQGLAPGETRVVGEPTAKYTGERISLDFKDADIKDVLRFLADFGNFNLVLDASVQGKVTIKLRDVPWDQALDIILKNHGLGADIAGSVVRSAPAPKLQAQAAAERRLLSETEAAAALVTVTRTLSHAKVRDVAPHVEKVMSSRGIIIVDARTNTLIIQDVPSLRPTIESTLDELDR